METMNKKKRRKRKLVIYPRFYFMLALIVLLLALIVVVSCNTMGNGCAGSEPGTILNWASPTPTLVPTPTPTPEPTPTPKPTPHAIEASLPEKYDYKVHLEVDGVELEDPSTFRRQETISFPSAVAYTQLTGVTTFRGNNFRTAPAYGIVNLSQFQLRAIWTKKTGSLPRNDPTRSWTGSGWTGQPLMVQWPHETKQIMNMHDWAKEKDMLVEVIYPTMDGKVHFYDLETGEPTRDALDIGTPFKGTGSVDPRGYPMLILGSGDEYDDDSRKSRAFIYSLIDFTKLYEFGKQGTDSFALREFYAYDCAPLIDEKNDILIYPGENGVIYTMKLNTAFDAAAGTLSIAPNNIVKYRYDSPRSSTKIDQTQTPWLGYEGSPVVWNEHLYLPANDGLFQCIDLNTMSIVWIADTWDDTNGAPVLDVISETEAYLYVGTSIHFTADTNGRGNAPIFKIDAMTGEIVNSYQLNCHTVSGVSGGIQATAALGQGNMSDLILVTFCRTPDKDNGILVALDKESFEVRWDMPMDFYAWSSPCIIYQQDGKGFVLQADSGGNIYLIDGANGTILHKAAIAGSNFEASPAVFGDILVLGSRGQEIYGVKIS